MLKPIAVEAREGYRIWVRFNDGASGEIDLSDMAGRGVFAAWNDCSFFESVRLTEYRAIARGDDIDICADALYMEITGKTLDELALVEQGAPANA